MPPPPLSPAPPPPGVRLLPDFLSGADAAAVLAALDGPPAAAPWEALAGRRVAHFGRRFDFASRGVGGPAPGLPPAAASAVARAALAAGLGAGGGDGGGGRPAPALSTLQVTANDYPPGAGIHWHVDTHGPFGPALAVLSLGSGAALELRQAAGGGGGGGGRGSADPPAWRRASVWLPANSLLILEGEARLGWEHAIIGRKNDILPAGGGNGNGDDDGGGGGGGGGSPPRPIIVPRARRVSLTIRTLRPPTAPPCACAWPGLCDAQGGGLGPTRDELKRRERESGTTTAPAAALAAAAQAAAAASLADTADLGAAEAAASAGLAALAVGQDQAAGAAAALAFESALVRGVYDRIAPHFSDTRVALWPQVTAFVRALGPHALILDVGCGNGKYLSLARPSGGSAVLASEPCPALAAAAAAAGPPGRAGAVIIADGLAPTWRAGVADGAICIAVVHHLASTGRRSGLIARCARALAPGGAALITAWARPSAQPAGKDAARAARWRPVPGGGPGDFLVPWHEPPGWDPARPTTAVPPHHHTGAPPAVPAPTPLPPPVPGVKGTGRHGVLTPAERAAQSALDRARQPPPAAWRFYHCYEGGELEREAAVGAALAAREAAEAGEVGVVYSLGEGGAVLDRGNWCVVVRRGGGG